MIPAGHNPVLIDQKDLADGQHAILVRCDDDPATDSWHSFTITAVTTSTDVQNELNGHLDRVSNLHAAKMNAVSVLKTLVVSTPVAKPTSLV
jgi:hypothetical protein